MFERAGDPFGSSVTRTPSGDTGRGERIRTSDTLVPNQVRYQAALRPEALASPVQVPAKRVGRKPYFLRGAGAGAERSSLSAGVLDDGVLPPAQPK